MANMSFNAIRENKILAKISEFTVCLRSAIAIGRSLKNLLVTQIASYVYIICNRLCQISRFQREPIANKIWASLLREKPVFRA